MSRYTSFDGPPLVAGSINGIRKFKFDMMGRLHSVNTHYLWRPGVNKATCLANSSQVHQCGKGGCSCGFYAFTNPNTNELDSFGRHTITAIIEGSGLCTVGTLGFRAEKAKIKAIAVSGGHMPKWAFRLCRWMLSFQDEGLAFGLSSLLLIVSGVVATSTTTSLWPWNFCFLGLILLGLAMFSGLLYVSDHPTLISEPDFQLVYPGVEIFHSVKKMLKAYPLSHSDYRITPEHPDFWEVQADVV